MSTDERLRSKNNYLNSDDRTLSFGVVIAVISAVSFGLNTTFAKISYAGGANAITFAVVRTVAILALAVLLISFLKREWRIPRGAYTPIICTALGQAGLSICILSAVQFIPITLALLIMYIYPALVLIIEAAMLRKAPKIPHAIACLCAIAGLTLVLGPSFEDLDWLGATFAVGASISVALLTLAMRAARRQVNEVTALLWSNLGSLPILLVLWPLLGGIALPTTPTAWTALTIGSLLFIAGFFGYAISLRYVSAGRAAIIYYFEPLAALIAATAILGESLTTVQVCGALLVFASVLFTTRT